MVDLLTRTYSCFSLISKENILWFFKLYIPANYELSRLGLLKMKEKKILKEARISDPYVDRRSGEDRRQVYNADYFQNGGLERRSGKERRRDYERRKDCTRVSDWSSICSVDKD
jgi:hypothetical protein